MEQTLRLLVRQGWDDLLNLVFPPTCVNCGRVGSLLCSICWEDEVEPATHPASPIPELDEIISLANHTGAIRQAIHALKYESVKGIARPLADHLALCIPWTCDAIVPVPLHADRLRERGYNQAQLLAEALGSVLQCPVSPYMLRRDKYSASQVGMNAAERKANVENAFSIQRAVVPRVLLVDDVRTTGATLTACAKVLREAGVTTVYGATISVAVQS